MTGAAHVAGVQIDVTEVVGGSTEIDRDTDRCDTPARADEVYIASGDLVCIAFGD